jgi:AbrB family looped-hinge helix DNA binding protein
MQTVQTKQTPFSLVRVKSKGQVTIPSRMREELHLSDGDFLEVVVKNNGVFFIPKTLVNREIDEIFDQGMNDYRKGNGSGTFSSVKEFKASRKKLKAV